AQHRCDARTAGASLFIPGWRGNGHGAGELLGRFLYHNVTVGHGATRPMTDLVLTTRTSLERTAPESLTRALYGFVHGNIWNAVPEPPLDRVGGRGFTDLFGLQLLMAGPIATASLESSEESARPCAYCVLAALRGCAITMNWSASSL